MLIGSLEHAGGGMRDIVNARAAETVVLEQGGGFMQVTAMIFEIGSGATQLGDEVFEPLGNRLPCPGISHSHAQTVDMAQSGGTGNELMMMRIQGQES